MRARGFTLLEVMVAGTIAILAIGMTMGVFLSQNRAFVTLDYARDANGNGRDAVLEMQSALKRAAFGIDPALAFDFSCPVGSNCHDRINAPDDLTFYARNPEYVWTAQNSTTCTTGGGCFGAGNIWPIPAAGVTGSGPYGVTITVKAGDVFHKGRNVLLVCPDGGNPVFATVQGTVTGPATGVSVAVNATGLISPNNPKGCNAGGGAALLLIDKFHYFVTTLNGEPWLVLDTGLDYDGDNILPPTDVNDLVPVARGVEDFQVAYQIGQAVVPPFTTVGAPDSNTNWVIGDDPGTQEEPLTSAAPPLGGASSGTKHPGNIRSVRVTLVLRSSQGDSSLNPGGGDPAFLSENRNDITAVTVGQYRRYPQTFSVAIRNMTAPNPYLLF
jgi:type IV pilus assembly protein PilW